MNEPPAPHAKVSAEMDNFVSPLPRPNALYRVINSFKVNSSQNSELLRELWRSSKRAFCEAEIRVRSLMPSETIQGVAR